MDQGVWTLSQYLQYAKETIIKGSLIIVLQQDQQQLYTAKNEFNYVVQLVKIILPSQKSSFSNPTNNKSLNHEKLSPTNFKWRSNHTKPKMTHHNIETQLSSDRHEHQLSRPKYYSQKKPEQVVIVCPFIVVSHNLSQHARVEIQRGSSASVERP